MADDPLGLVDDPLGAYLSELDQVPAMTREEEIELARRIRSGDEQAAESARRRLVEANLRLVVSIAERYRDRGVDFLDLVQEGNASLSPALESFTAGSSDSFSVHAATYIERAIKDVITGSSAAPG
jgi:RNA polymerase primary sigma factor